MTLSKNLKKIMISGAALLMFTSVGASMNNVNVSARHVRTHRAYRKHSKKALRRYNHKRNVHKYNLKRSNHLSNVHKLNAHEHKLSKELYKAFNHGNYKKAAKMNKRAYYQGYNRMNTKAYHQGYRDGWGSTANKDDAAFTPRYKNNKQYKLAYIYAAQHSDLFRLWPHKDALANFNYIKSHLRQLKHYKNLWSQKKNPSGVDDFGSTF